MTTTKHIHIPSTVGVGKLDVGGLTLGTFSKRNRADVPHYVAWGDASNYLVGNNLHQYARPLESLNFQRFADGLGMRPLTYATLGLLLGEGEHHTSIMVGLPVEVMEDKPLLRKTKRSLRDWLEGTHTFSVDHKETIVHVEKVAAMPQPAGTFFAWGLNNHGQWIKTAEDFDATIAICDVGFNTLDVFTLQGGKVMRRFTGGDTVGMRQAVELISRSLKNQYDVRYSLHEVDEFIRGGNTIISNAAGRLDLSNLIADAKSTASDGVNTFLGKQWGNGRQFDDIIFTGGGAAAIRDALIEQYPLGYIMPDPVMANAQGLARYGKRYFDTDVVIGLDPGFGGFKGVLL
ncbi:MAG: ParM/StbA family protein [Chloroflexi bacterium]|nr:ParM/StbA family protein [Chloroflexota bacterium]